MNALRTTKIATVALSLSLAAFAVAGCSGGGGSKGSLPKFCSDYVAMANTSQMRGLLTDNNNGTLSLAAPPHLSGLKQVAGAMQKLAKDAPTAIRSEAQ